MANPSLKWLRRMVLMLRYYAALVALATILADISYITEISFPYLSMIAGGSLVGCVFNYLCIRAVGYCYVQRHLIWMTAYNLIYNSVIMQTSWSWKYKMEIIMLVLLSFFLIWAVVHFIREVRNGVVKLNCKKDLWL